MNISQYTITSTMHRKTNFANDLKIDSDNHKPKTDKTYVE